jgi:hypothetical protein
MDQRIVSIFFFGKKTEKKEAGAGDNRVTRSSKLTFHGSVTSQPQPLVITQLENGRA